MRTSILAALLVACVPVVAHGQAQVRFPRAKSLEVVSLDLATGTVRRGPAIQQLSASTVSDFPNLDLGGFISADTGGGFCEWFEAGTKGINGNASDLMNNFVFAYCSAALDVNSGGPGGATTIGFYEGYVTGGGTTTTAVAILTLNGLPANTAFSSPFVQGGGTACYLIDVTLAALVPFADGPIGYSWLFRDLDAGGLVAATLPSLVSLPSAGGLGLDDLVDKYCPPGFLLSTFDTGGASMSMDIREVADCAASVASYNSTSPANVDVLTAANPVVGTGWSAEVTHAAGTASFATLIVRGAKIPGNGAGAGQYGRLLVTGAFLANLPGMPDALPPIQASQRNFATALPLQFGICCQDWFAQALTGGGGATRLSNGIASTTGTF